MSLADRFEDVAAQEDEEPAQWPRCSRCGIRAEPGASCPGPAAGRCPWVLEPDGRLSVP